MSDPIRKWREDAELREAERARARRELERKQNCVVDGHEAAALRAQFETRLNSLELGYSELQLLLVEATRATADAVTDLFDKLSEQHAGLSSKQRGELRELKIELAKLGSTLAELREKHVEFKFAREQGLPTPKLDS